MNRMLDIGAKKGKNVLVAGTYVNPPKYPKDSQSIPLDQFIGAAKAIGYSLAKNGYNIYVGVPTWRDFDASEAKYVVQGANEYLRENNRDTTKDKIKIIFFQPYETPPPEANILDQFEFINIEHKNIGEVDNPYNAQLTTEVDQIDGVILIGGGEGTASIGYACCAMKKPVIPIASMGGASRAIFNDVISKKLDDLKKENKINSDLSILLASWKEDENSKTVNQGNISLSDQVIDLYQEYDRELSRKTRQIPRWFGLVFLFLILLWIFLFSNLEQLSRASQAAKTTENNPQVIATVTGDSAVVSPAAAQKERSLLSANPQYSFWLLLLTSSILGTCLRTYFFISDNTLGEFDFISFITTVISSLVITIVLALFYLLGSLSFTGEIIVLDPNTKQVTSIATSLSLIGMASGILLPIDSVKQLLTKFLPGISSITPPVPANKP